MEDITDQFNSLKQRRSSLDLSLVNRQKSVRFRASLVLLIAFFLFVSTLHVIGLFIFTKGFLLTRLVLDHESKCDQPPLELAVRRNFKGTYDTGCWQPKVFDKAVVVVIDALRYDFTVPYSRSQSLNFHNTLTVLHDIAVTEPQNAFLLPFIADPPTTTLQRLKGLTTGTLPTFIDAGSNFAGTAIEEDNLVAQLRSASKTLVHLGDDTWHSLFPGHFDANLTHAYDSFNVWDLHTVDQGVTTHLLPLLDNKSQWDVIFSHYLGVDHAGHRYGPDHSATRTKLAEMDLVLRKIISAIDRNTLLVVMGDHGMDAKGDHGGESDDEVEAALWMYSKRGIFGHGHNKQPLPPTHAKERPVAQIDLVPTFALLLGLPIPFNNLGSPISEAFAGPGPAPDWEQLANVNALTAAQIARYQTAYIKARGLDTSVFSIPQLLWRQGLDAMETTSWGRKFKNPEKVFEVFKNYHAENLGICRSLWAQFNIPNMVIGGSILASSLVILLFFARSQRLDRAAFSAVALLHMSIGACIGLAMIMLWEQTRVSPTTSLAGFAFGGISGALLAMAPQFRISFPHSIWSYVGLFFCVSQAAGFAANSYTIWEDEILGFFLSTFAMLALSCSVRRSNRQLGIWQSLAFLALTRLASFSRLCREEQMPYCRSTYYASSTTSTSAPWQLLLPVATAIALPYIFRAIYRQTMSYHGVADVFTGAGLRVCLSSIALFWILDAADNENWPVAVQKEALQTVRMVLARLILGVSLFVGPTLFIKSRPCVGIRMADADPTEKRRTVQVYGGQNALGSHFFMAMISLLVSLMLLQKPMGNAALAILAIQILLLAEIISINRLRGRAIGPVVLAALGNYHFFKTGHQATLASIQWDTAFIPLTTIRYPWSPLLVVANTYAAQILTAAAVPLLVLWRHPPRRSDLLSNIAQVLATFLLYHATMGLATTVFAGHLRRHLMLFRIFSPRFMTAAAALGIVDLVGVFLGLGTVWWSVSSVASIFGWA